MEQGRFNQVNTLKEKGWTVDHLCTILQEEDESIGGPTYMLAPNSSYYAVSCGRETPLDEVYVIKKHHTVRQLTFTNGMFQYM